MSMVNSIPAAHVRITSLQQSKRGDLLQMSIRGDTGGVLVRCQIAAMDVGVPGSEVEGALGGVFLNGPDAGIFYVDADFPCPLAVNVTGLVQACYQDALPRLMGDKIIIGAVYLTTYQQGIVIAAMAVGRSTGEVLGFLPLAGGPPGVVQQLKPVYLLGWAEIGAASGVTTG